MKLADRLGRFIAAIIIVPFIFIALAILICVLIFLGFCMLFLPLAVLIEPDILKIDNNPLA